MSHPRPGPHELGQNFLIDQSVIDRILDLVRRSNGPLVEWGTGNGAITLPLAALGRRLVGVDIDATRARQLDRRTGAHVCISEGDILRHAPPNRSTVVANVPFHLTTPIVRHLLDAPGWEQAILITQWEYARKRAAVGGTTQLTAQWWPWFEFNLDRRIPSTAFRPRPSVDAGLLLIDRRSPPLLSDASRNQYQAWVARVFSGRGRNLAEVLTRSGLPRAAARDLVRRHGGRPPALPRNLRAEDWVIGFNELRSARGSASRGGG